MNDLSGRAVRKREGEKKREQVRKSLAGWMVPSTGWDSKIAKHGFNASDNCQVLHVVD